MKKFEINNITLYQVLNELIYFYDIKYIIYYFSIIIYYYQLIINNVGNTI